MWHPRNFKIGIYLECIIVYEYGELALILLMEDFEKEQDYEECANILKALKRYNRIYKENVPLNKKGYQEYLIANSLSQEEVQKINDDKDEIRKFVNSYPALD